MKRAAIACALIVLAACGGGGDDDDADADVEPTTTTTTAVSAAASDDVCDAARAIAEEDDQFQGELNGILQRIAAASSTEEAEAALEEIGPALAALDEQPLLDAYARLEDELSGELRDAARTLRTFTASFLADIRAATSAEEMVAVVDAISTDPATADAGRAALTLDEWSREECEVVIAD